MQHADVSRWKLGIVLTARCNCTAAACSAGSRPSLPRGTAPHNPLDNRAVRTSVLINDAQGLLCAWSDGLIRADWGVFGLNLNVYLLAGTPNGDQHGAGGGVCGAPPDAAQAGGRHRPILQVVGPGEGEETGD